MRFTWAALTAVFLARAPPALAETVATGSSPDGTITVQLEIDNDGRAGYSISRKGKLLIAPSRLGFLLTDSQALVRNFALLDSATR